jgi:hypothetical protein
MTSRIEPETPDQPRSRRCARLRFGLVGVVQLPCLSQHAPDRSVQRFGQSLHNVAGLWTDSGTSEGSTDRLGQGLCAVDDEEPRHGRVETALDESVDERPDGRGVLRCTLYEAERMLVTFRVDTERRNEDQIFVHVNDLDLYHSKLRPERSDAIHSLMRAADSATKR